MADEASGEATWEYDPDKRSYFLKLSDARIAKARVEKEANLVMDFDKDGNLVGMEIYLPENGDPVIPEEPNER